MPVELVRLENALVGYAHPLLPPINLAVHPSDRLAVLGPNGSGKSTLLRSLLGLNRLLGGARVFPSGRAPHVGYVPQAHRSDLLFPLTAEQVVLQGRYGRIGIGRFAARSDRDFARQQLERVGLGGSARQLFRSLSGGQRQRVLLARALCGEPELLVLDEFTSELDPAAAARLLREVIALTRESKVALVFVTHVIGDAATHAERVALVDARRDIFEVGDSATLLTGERLSSLYGQKVEIERRADRTVVFVETGRDG